MRIYKTEEFMKCSKNMHVFKCDISTGSTDEIPHTHEFIEIVYVLSGYMTHAINGKTYKVKHGDILFMNYGCTHAFFSEEECSYINILFSPEVMSEEIVTPSNAFSALSLIAFNDMRGESNYGKISFWGEERREIEDIVFDMLKEYSEKQTSWETVLGNDLNTLIIKMLRKTEMGMEPSEIRDIWQKLSEYIDNNLDSKLTLNDLAKKCFYNPSYFSRIFKEKFKISFLEYVTQKRLARAIELLKNTDVSVSDVGQRVGFSDNKSFYHAFSRYYHCTPSQYRKKQM